MPRSNVNPLIKLAPRFESKVFINPTGRKQTFRKQDVESADVKSLINQLELVERYYENISFFDDLLITIRYKSVISKTRTTKSIFKYNKKEPYDYMVGSKFHIKKGDEFVMKHQTTYKVSVSNVEFTIEQLKIVLSILDRNYNGVFHDHYFEKEQREKENSKFTDEKMSKTTFYSFICDISNIESIFVLEADFDTEDDMLLSLYDIFDNEGELRNFLEKIGISRNRYDVYDKCNIRIINKYDVDLLLESAKFLVVQGVVDLNKVIIEEKEDGDNVNPLIWIEDPKNEPTIGVFDSYFDDEAYFSKWVEAVPSYTDGIDITDDDKEHGTQVCNIIVDGPAHNKWLEDDCGKFKIKLFEIGLKKSINFTYLYKNLERIVGENNQIKVWNFSLGSYRSANRNQISLLAEKIDYVCKKYNVIFVVSGTNINRKYPNETYVGFPADSLNAIVVNSVDRNGNPASYTRTGPVLTLYTKPDVSYYGGVKGDPIIAYSKNPNNYCCTGTSFAAPWISRKLAYLIHYMHLDPLVAKALIIDSAARWERKDNYTEIEKKGYGVVPISIWEILKSDSDEIKFYFSDETLAYTTLLTTIPVPFDEKTERFRYTAKATICYYASGDRRKGVDYCTTEMDIKFGRNEKKIDSKGIPYLVIDSIDSNKQYNSDESVFISNEEACLKFQKWNNTKHIVAPKKKKQYGLKKKFNKYWGLSVTQIDRFESKNQPADKYNQKFGIVVTIKTIDGMDASIQTFINDCVELKLNPINVIDTYSVEVYNNEQSEIVWDI